VFLDRVCEHDVALREEILSLLANHDESGEFLDTPIASVPSLLGRELRPAVPEPDTQIGARIGAYRIEKEIGRGGMGEVYLATRADSEFEKRVAIKLIRDGAESALAIGRFRRERQILARLENAYIARLIDGGTTPDGLPYFVMEYVEGVPINHYCDAHLLTIRDRLSLFLKVCSAVQYAHERNIIHRDLKPGNILVKRDGTPKLLDFGIAKILSGEGPAADREATQQTTRLLTPAYASPEQLRGHAATRCSDIYSLGVILYELLCGKRPDETHFRVDVTTMCSGDAHLSAPLRAVVLRSIQLDPADRYPSVESFAADIRRYLSGSPSSTDTLDAGTQPESKVSLAILPFRVLGDQSSASALLAPGITETLITKLSRIERLSIPPPSAVLKYTGGVEAVRASRELRVEYVLEGSLHFFAGSVRANVQLVFAEAGIAVWAGQVEATENTLQKMEDSIAEQVAYAILPHITGEERAELSRWGTTSGPAHAAYLRGRWYWNNAAGDQEKLLRALVCFTEATTIDPKFARAHAGIADYYVRMGLWGGLPPSESFAAAINSAQTALELEPGLGEAHASLGFALWAYNRDEEAAEKHFSLAILRSPNYGSAHHWFGLLNSARNRPELAIANLERAQRLDPNSVLIAAALGFVYYNARDYDTSLRLLTNAARELPESGIIQEMLAWCYLKIGDTDAALECAKAAVELSKRASDALSTLARAESAVGNTAAATQLRAEIEERTNRMYVSGYDRATAALAVGDSKSALRLLKQSKADRDWWFCWTEVDPRWDALRKDVRFSKLLPQRGPRKFGGQNVALSIAAACLVLVASFVLIWRLTHAGVLPFASVKFTKLTTNGTADTAAISPDGKTVVYAARDSGDLAIWKRDLQTGRTVKIVDRVGGTLTGLGFTDYGKSIQFVTFPVKNPGSRSISVTSITGGNVASLNFNYPGPVNMDLSGVWLAYYTPNLDQGEDELWVMQIANGHRRVLTSYKYPARFAWNCRPTWSSDSKRIAYAAEDRDAKGFFVRLWVVDVNTGARHPVASPRWQWVQSVQWTSNNSALAVVGQEHESSFQQIWYVPYGGSRQAPRRIGNDLDDYIGASVTARGSEIVSVQSQTLSNIFVARQGELSHPVQLTPGSGRYFDLSWVPDGRILYASDATGSADIWLMDGNGSTQRQITFGTGRSYAPAASPDSKLVAFHSNRTGNWQVWSTNIDGGTPTQLSSSAGDGNWPQFTADGKSVVFHRSSPNGIFNLWRVSAEGGRAHLLTSAFTMHPAVSRTTGKIAAWYSDRTDHPEWKLAIFGPDGAGPQQVLNPTPNARPDTPIVWMPKGDAISILDFNHSVANIWMLPTDGRPPRQITSFDSGDIYSFDWSPKGDLLYSRGLTTSDVVLIRDVTASKESK
jgi:serine/threonine protein kinase/Tol biopolymer transport system component/tetratricopeptide (TPR) repeat protein